jgi:predicted nucleotidyltransferase
MTLLMQNISINPEEIAKFCQKHHIQHLAIFGSALGDTFSDHSDIDVIVEFAPKHIPHLITFMAIEDELSTLLSRTVDLNTPKSLGKHIRQRILESAEVIYG